MSFKSRIQRDPDYKSRAAAYVRQRKENADISEREREINTAAHRERQTDSKIRTREQRADTAARSERRADLEIRVQEQQINTVAHRERRNNRSWESVYEQFLNAVKEGPIHTCYSCDRLYFKRSIRITSKSKILSKPATSCTE